MKHIGSTSTSLVHDSIAGEAWLKDSTIIAEDAVEWRPC
jgi:hypothetical protein